VNDATPILVKEEWVPSPHRSCCPAPFIRAARVDRLASFRPTFRNLASFELGWPKKSYALISTCLALKNSCSLLAFFGLFALKQISLKENITIPFFRQYICKILVIARVLMLAIFEGYEF